MVCLRRLGAAALALFLFLGPAPRAAAESGGPAPEIAVSDWAGLKAALRLPGAGRQDPAGKRY